MLIVTAHVVLKYLFIICNSFVSGCLFADFCSLYVLENFGGIVIKMAMVSLF